MCGICGQVNFESEHHVASKVLERMQFSLSHRGPDSRGMWTKDSVGLAHTRLAIIDLSENGHQPMCNENGTVWIVYNGEVYNFHDLREELQSKGHHFRSQTDTEVVIHLYEEEGIQCLSRLRGMFAFAVWDDNKRQLFLARDRLGQKPLYYYVDERRLLFASEIKSILASKLVEISPDYQALYQYLCLGYVPHPKTGFRGIKKLPPGHYLVTDGAKVILKPYWSLQVEPSDNEIVNEKEASLKLLDLLTEATQMRLVSDVPVGVLLSGGIDSSAVAAIMSRFSSRIKTFTIGFEDELYDERKEARFLAEKLQTDHHEMVVKPKITDLLPKIARAYDEPFADPSSIPTYCVAQLAGQQVKVVLNGDGGDESFAGYGEYIQGALGTWMKKIPSSAGVFLSRILDRKRPGKAKSLSQVLALSGQPQALIFSYLRLLVPLSHLRSLLHPDYKKLIGSIDPVDHLTKNYERLDGGDIVNTLLAVDRETFLPDDLLFKIDIATMAQGLEARSPLLDHHLVKFVAGLPGNMKLRKFNKKYIFKEALKDILPAEVLNRRKRGFDVPVGHWLKSELLDVCRDVLLTSDLIAEIFKTDKLNSMFEDHLNDRKDWGRFFWMILMLDLWSKAFLRDGTACQK